MRFGAICRDIFGIFKTPYALCQVIVTPDTTPQGDCQLVLYAIYSALGQTLSHYIFIRMLVPPFKPYIFNISQIKCDDTYNSLSLKEVNGCNHDTIYSIEHLNYKPTKHLNHKELYKDMIDNEKRILFSDSDIFWMLSMSSHNIIIGKSGCLPFYKKTKALSEIHNLHSSWMTWAFQ